MWPRYPANCPSSESETPVSPSDDTRQRGATAIARYLAALNPEGFGPLARVFFCFANHAKIILTDAVVYVGSANYSEESARNWEAGVVIRDPTALAAIAAAVDEIEADSVEYFGETMRKAVAPGADQ